MKGAIKLQPITKEVVVMTTATKTRSENAAKSDEQTIDQKVDELHAQAEALFKEVEEARKADEKILEEAGDALGSIGDVFQKIGRPDVAEENEEAIKEDLGEKPKFTTRAKDRAKKIGNGTWKVTKPFIPDNKEKAASFTTGLLVGMSPIGGAIKSVLPIG